jgi:hypothetical protein
MAPVRKIIDGILVQSKKVVKVLGVMYNSKLKWSDHITHAINCANRVLNAINPMRKFFNLKELINKIASNCYLILV